jgi:hypothetical protein
MHLKTFSLARTLLLTGSFAGLLLAATPSRAQNDTPPGAARLAHVEGSVSIQPNGVDGWGQAYSDMPIGPGDRLAAAQPGRGELQAGPVRAYFNDASDVTLINLFSPGVEMGVADGSVAIFSDGFPYGGGFSVQTPNGAVTVSGRAGFRLDVFASQQSTIVTDYPGQGVITLNGGGGFYMDLHPGESVQLIGTNPVMAQPLEPAPFDMFTHWSGAIESHRFNSVSAQYVNVEMPGYDELDNAGDWQAQSDYGPIWFPRVQAGWAPYHFGHWVNIPFYGWSWVADEPWGAAPFHYGRWVAVGGRWGWIPGPREGHPIWSPAQVVFAGGIQFGGAGVAVWFPLGPGEAYRPWYPCSPTYINQINITNIHESSVVHVQVNYVNIVNVTNVTYVNRTIGVTAVSQADFASGRSTKEAFVKVDPKQMEHVQPLAKPAAPPPAQRIILHPTPKPANVPAARPVLINSKGQMAAATPGAKPVPPPVKPVPTPAAIPGHAPAGKPTVGGKPVEPPAKMDATKPPPPAARMPAEPAKPAAPAAKTPMEPAKPATPMAKPATEPAKPAEAKPAETKPAEAKPAEAKPGDKKPATKDDKKKDDKKKPEDKKPE